MRTLLVIPAFEEEDSLADVLTEVKRELPSLDILVIDDGSTDHTAAVARKAGALVCSLPFNLGVGGALRTGFRYAMLNGYDSCVQLDADGQHLPSEVPVLMAGWDSARDGHVLLAFTGSSCLGGKNSRYDIGFSCLWSPFVKAALFGDISGVHGRHG